MNRERPSEPGNGDTRTGLSNRVLGILLAVLVLIWFLIGIVWIVIY